MSEGVVISKRLVLVNSISSIGARLISVSVLVWLHQYLLKRISPEEYSVYPVVVAVIAFMPLLTRVMTAGVARYVVEAYAKKDDERVTEIVSTMFPPLLGVGFLMIVGGWLVSLQIEHILTIPEGRAFDAGIMFGLMLTLTALTAVLTPFTCGLEVKQMFVLENVLQLGTELLRLALLCVLLFGVSTRVLWVVVATFGSQVVRLAVMQFLSQHYVPAIRFRFGAIQWGRFRELTSFGVWSFILQASEMVMSNVPVILLNQFSLAIDVTCYHLGAIVMKQVQSLALLASSPLQPVLTAFHATGSLERISNVYIRGGRYALWAVMFIAAPMIVHAPTVIRHYVGIEFLEAAMVMRLLLLCFPIAYGNVMMGKIAIARAMHYKLAVRRVAMVICMILLCIYSVYYCEMGATGAAFSILGVSLIWHPIFFWTLGFELTGVTFSSWFRKSLMRGLAPSLVACPIWLVVEMILPSPSLSILLLSVFGGAVVYIGVIYFACMDDQEHHELLTAWRGAYSRIYPRKRKASTPIQ